MLNHSGIQHIQILTSHIQFSKTDILTHKKVELIFIYSKKRVNLTHRDWGKLKNLIGEISA